MKRYAKLLLCVAPLLLAACAGVTKAVSDVHELVTHKPEVVTYPDVADIPAKPAPSNTAEERKQTLQALEADRVVADAQVTNLRNQAAKMPALDANGKPVKPETTASQTPATQQ